MCCARAGGISLRNLASETLPLLGLLWVVEGAGRMFTPASREQSVQAAQLQPWGSWMPSANTRQLSSGCSGSSGHFQADKNPALLRSWMLEGVKHFGDSSKPCPCCCSLRAWWPQSPPGLVALLKQPLQKEELRWSLGFTGTGGSCGGDQGSSWTQVWGQQGWVWGRESCTPPELLGNQLCMGRGHPGRLHSCHGWEWKGL